MLNQHHKLYKVIKNFVDAKDIDIFFNDMRDKDSFFVENTAGNTVNRKYLRLDETDHFSDIHLKYYFKIAKTLGIKLPRVDHYLGILYSRIGHGGNIHAHKDTLWPYESVDDFINFRFNLMLNRGEGQGYNPIIEDEEINVNTGDAWCFPASISKHWTKPILASEDRCVIQYGFLVTRREFDDKLSMLWKYGNY